MRKRDERNNCRRHILFAPEKNAIRKVVERKMINYKESVNRTSSGLSNKILAVVRLVRL